MKNFIKGREKWVYTFTNHSIEQLQQTEGFNKNHIAKVLVEHIETYKTIIDNLLENASQTNKTSYSSSSSKLK